MDSGACRVQGQLANGNPHAPRPKVPEAQDAFIVRRHDQPDIPCPHIRQHLLHPPVFNPGFSITGSAGGAGL